MVDQQSTRAAAAHDYGQFGQWADELAQMRDAIGDGTVRDDGFGLPVLEFGHLFRYIQQDGTTGQVMFGWMSTDEHNRVTQLITKAMPVQVAVATARRLLAEESGARA